MGGAVLSCPRDGGHDLGRCCGCRQRTVLGIEQRLPLQVGQVHNVVIDQADGADAGRRQVKRQEIEATAGYFAEPGQLQWVPKLR